MALQFSANAGFYSGYPSSGLSNAQGDQSLCCWINSAVLGGVGNGGAAASMCGFYNGTYNASTAPTTATQIGSRSGTTIDVWTWGGAVMISSTGTAPAANTWYHVVYTYTSSTTTHRLYINGVLNNTLTNSIQLPGTFTQLYLNGFPQTGSATSETSSTKVDGVRSFNRVLSAAEIITIFNSTGFRDGIAYGQNAHYLMDGPPSVQSGTLYDLSGTNSTINLYATTTNVVTFINGPINSLSRPCV
jgi:hypothetical protein